jgi:hypothetical protein
MSAARRKPANVIALGRNRPSSRWVRLRLSKIAVTVIMMFAFRSACELSATSCWCTFRRT